MVNRPDSSSSSGLRTANRQPTSAEVESELVAYIHGERTTIPYDVIRQFIMADPVVRDAHAELLLLAEMLGHLPTAETMSSREFVRQVASQLPRLKAEGKTTRRMEEMVLRMQLTVEDRVVMMGEYWRYRMRQRPVASVALVAAVLALMLTAAWLPGQFFAQPAPSFSGSGVAQNSPAHPADTGEGSALNANLPGTNPMPTAGGVNGTQVRHDPVDPAIPGVPIPNSEPGENPVTRYERDVVDGQRPPELHTPSDPAAPPIDHNRLGGIGQAIGLRIPTVAAVADWFSPRKDSDEMRRVSPSERRMIDEALAWLAANQNADGSWGDEKSTLPGGDQMTPTGDRPLPSVLAVQTTARALLAFLAENYASRASDNAALRPTRSPNIAGSAFEAQVRRYREVVKRGLRFLTDAMDPDTGRFGAAGDNSMIAHAEAVQALAEDHIIGMNWRLVVHLRRAVDYLLSNRNTHDGGWGHRPGAPSTLLPTVSTVQALLIYSATNGATIDRTAPTFARAADFVQSCCKIDPDAGMGMADETPTWSHSVSVPRSTAAAVAVGHLLWNCGMTEPHPGFWNSALNYLGDESRLPQWIVGRNFTASSGETKCDFDYWLYFSQALSGWSRSAPSAVIQRVNHWRNQMVEVLNENAVRNDREKLTSWPAAGWAINKSNSWSTATALLALQNHYRYAWLTR